MDLQSKDVYFEEVCFILWFSIGLEAQRNKILNILITLFIDRHNHRHMNPRIVCPICKTKISEHSEFQDKICRTFTYLNGTWVRTPETKLMNIISETIERYGYAVVIIHPQDFVNVDESRRFVNVLNESEIQELSSLMDLVTSKI